MAHCSILVVTLFTNANPARRASIVDYRSTSSKIAQQVFMTKRNRLCIVMDYADGGDLHGWIKTRKGALIPETEIQERFVQICEALHHVHSQKVNGCPIVSREYYTRFPPIFQS